VGSCWDRRPSGHEENMTEVFLSGLANRGFLCTEVPEVVLAPGRVRRRLPTGDPRPGASTPNSPKSSRRWFHVPGTAVEQFKALRQLGILRDRLRAWRSNARWPVPGPQAARQIRRTTAGSPWTARPHADDSSPPLHLHQLRRRRASACRPAWPPGPLPGFKGHMQGKLFQYPRVDLIVTLLRFIRRERNTDSAGWLPSPRWPSARSAPAPVRP